MRFWKASGPERRRFSERADALRGFETEKDSPKNKKLCGDPGGIRTRDLDLERVASWARLDDGVSERQYT